MPWCKCAKCAAKSGQVLSNSWPNSSCFQETTHPQINQMLFGGLKSWDSQLNEVHYLGGLQEKSKISSQQKNNHSSPWPCQAGKDFQNFILSFKHPSFLNIPIYSICPSSYLPTALPIYLPTYLSTLQGA